MKFSVLIACSLALVAPIVADDVLDLTNDFEDKIKELDTVLVKFYAPWCGHCKRLAPEFEKAAGSLIKNDPVVNLAKVDCTADGGKDICSKHGVNGYPTLKIFRGGEVSADYNGPREAGGIVKYMKSQVGPASKELKTVAELDSILAKDEVVIIGLFKSDSSDLAKAFLKVADKQRETYTFAHSSNADVLKKAKKEDAVVLYRPKKFANKFEDSEVVYSGSADRDEIDTFVKKNVHGLVGHRTQENYAQFDSPLLVAYYDVDYTKNAKGTNYWRNRILKVAKEFKDRGLNFAVCNKEQFAAEMDEYGLVSSVKQPVVAIKNEKGQKFRMTDDFTMDTFKSFLEEYFAGKLTPHMKSEPLPEKNDGPVKVAVAENFDQLVIESDKDALIEFYAPWCGHCKSLAPAYEELGTKMADENVLIVKMDATANDVPANFEVRGFPTLYWLSKADKKNPKRYEGGRAVDDFVKYIAKHATDELKGFDRSGKPKKSEL